MRTRITVIIDNIPNGDLQGEWGLSLLVRYGDRNILVDAGSSDAFAENMKKLGLEIGDVDAAVLSHAHYDHSLGMARFFSDNDKAPFLLREGAGENCYAKKFFFRKYIGIPKGILKKYGDRIRMISGDHELYEGAWLIPHKTEGLESIGRREMMYVRHGLRFLPDDFAHEQSLVLDTDKGLVIINSCSHGGAVNIINEVAATFPDKKVYGIIGGFHLFNKSEAEIREVCRGLRQTGVEYICTGHCTKERAYKIMREELGDKLDKLYSGLVIDL